jgi:hypothetical protein
MCLTQRHIRSRLAPGGGGSGNSFPVRDATTPAEIFLPAAGALPVVVPGAVANTLGAVVAVGAPVANDFFVSHVYHNAQAIPAVQVASHIVIWLHGAGAVVFNVCRRQSNIVDPTADTVGAFEFRSRMYGYRVPAGDQISVQAQCGVAGFAAGYTAWIAGWDGAFPTFPTLPLSMLPSGIGFGFPTNLTSQTLIAAVLPAFSAVPQQIVAAAGGNGILITEVQMNTSLTTFGATHSVAQIGIGAAGAEAWCASVAINQGHNSYELWPPVFVAPGLRAAWRVGSSAGTARSANFKAHQL